MGRIEGFDPETAMRRLAERAVIPAVDETLEAAAQHAARVTPVRTGRLAGGWHVTPARLEGTHVRGSFGNDVEYALYVDKGTRFLAARNMSGQAVDAEFPALPGRIESRL